VDKGATLGQAAPQAALPNLPIPYQKYPRVTQGLPGHMQHTANLVNLVMNLPRGLISCLALHTRVQGGLTVVLCPVLFITLRSPTVGSSFCES
jgi:hypothetical protein